MNWEWWDGEWKWWMKHWPNVCPRLMFSNETPRGLVWIHPDHLWSFHQCKRPTIAWWNLALFLISFSLSHSLSLSTLFHWSVNDRRPKDACGTCFDDVSTFDVSMVKLVVLEREWREPNYSFFGANHFPNSSWSDWSWILSNNFVQSLYVEWRRERIIPVERSNSNLTQLLFLLIFVRKFIFYASQIRISGGA